MSVLTETMTRLHDEIVSANRSRKAFRGELVRQTEERRSQVSALCTGFARDLAPDRGLQGFLGLADRNYARCALASSAS